MPGCNVPSNQILLTSVQCEMEMTLIAVDDDEGNVNVERSTKMFNGDDEVVDKPMHNS